MTSTARWPLIAPILLYTVSALEMIIMISPAAAFFYGSFYTPIFTASSAAPQPPGCRTSSCRTWRTRSGRHSGRCR